MTSSEKPTDPETTSKSHSGSLEKSLFRPVPEAPDRPWSIFRRRFTRGLAALLPTLLTIALLLWAYDLMYRTIGEPINRGFVRFLSAIGTPGEGGPLFKALDVDMVEDALRYGEPNGRVTRAGRPQTVEALALATPKPQQMEDETDKHYQRALSAYAKERNRVLWRIAYRKYWLHLLGLAVAIILCYFVGLFLASFIGRSVWRTVESFIRRLPIVKAIYPNIKQVTDFLFSESNVSFGGVVAVRYPRKGVWSIGLKTGGSMRSIVTKTGEDLVTIFIPSSPTPFTGYVIQAPSEDVIDLPMSIDQALRFAVSGGVIKPDIEILPGGEDFQAPSESDAEPAPARHSAVPDTAPRSP